MHAESGTRPGTVAYPTIIVANLGVVCIFDRWNMFSEVIDSSHTIVHHELSKIHLWSVHDVYESRSFGLVCTYVTTLVTIADVQTLWLRRQFDM